jgi:hypothetical protein
MENKKHLFYLGLIILFAGLIRVPSLTQPLGPDQGVVSVIAEGILKGELPYRDYWEMGSPAIFFTYALMFKIFGTSMKAIPMTDILVAMLSTYLVFLLSSHIWNRKVGYVSALLFAFFANGVRLGMHAGGDIAFGTFWYIAQRETFMIPLILASIYLLICGWERRNSFAYLAFSGVLAGLAFVYKFPSLIIFLVIILYLDFYSFIIDKQNQTVKNILVKNMVFTLGFLIAPAGFAAFFALKGVTNEMIDAVFKYIILVYGEIGLNHLGIMKMGLMHTLFIAQENFILWIFFLTSSVFILTSDRSKENIAVVLWSVASLLYVIAHREFFGYHYLLVLPPFSILAGYGLVKALDAPIRLRQLFTADLGKIFVILALVANLAFFTTLNYIHYTKFYYYVTGSISKEEYYAYFNAYPKHDYSFPVNYHIAQYLLENTNKNDTIYTIGGIEGVLHFLSKRKSPSRFVFTWILFSGRHGQAKQAKKFRQEVLKDLRGKKPKYIITVRDLETFKQFSGIYSFVKRNYSLARVFADDRFLYAYGAAKLKKI